MHAGNLHDRAPARRLAHHLLRDHLRQEERPLEVDADDPLPVLLRGFEEGLDVVDACVIDEAVDAAERGDGLPNEAAQVIEPAHVAAHRVRDAAPRAYGRGQLRQPIEAACGQHHAGAFGRAHLCDADAQPLTRAGDDDDPILEQHKTLLVVDEDLPTFSGGKIAYALSGCQAGIQQRPCQTLRLVVELGTIPATSSSDLKTMAPALEA